VLLDQNSKNGTHPLKSELDGSGVYLDEEVERFCAVYFKPKQRQSPSDHQAMNAALDPAIDRFKALRKENEAEAEVWRTKLVALRNLYVFLSQIIPYYDSDLDGPNAVGTTVLRENAVALSEVIDIINNRFGTDFNQADQLFFDQIIEAATNSAELQQAAQVNSADKFSLLFNRLLETLFVERMEQNEEIFARYMNDAAFQKLLSNLLGTEVYQRLAGEEKSLVQY